VKVILVYASAMNLEISRNLTYYALWGLNALNNLENAFGNNLSADISGNSYT
jgi:hypothetical protein